MEDFLGIAIVGATLSVLVEYIKTKYQTEKTKTKLITIGLAVLIGGLFWVFDGTPIMETTIGVLVTASTVYALIINRDEDIIHKR